MRQTIQACPPNSSMAVPRFAQHIHLILPFLLMFKIITARDELRRQTSLLLRS